MEKIIGVSFMLFSFYLFMAGSVNGVTPYRVVDIFFSWSLIGLFISGIALLITLKKWIWYFATLFVLLCIVFISFALSIRAYDLRSVGVVLFVFVGSLIYLTRPKVKERFK